MDKNYYKLILKIAKKQKKNTEKQCEKIVKFMNKSKSEEMKKECEKTLQKYYKALLEMEMNLYIAEESFKRVK